MEFEAWFDFRAIGMIKLHFQIPEAEVVLVDFVAARKKTLAEIRTRVSIKVSFGAYKKYTNALIKTSGVEIIELRFRRWSNVFHDKASNRLDF